MFCKLDKVEQKHQNVRKLVSNYIDVASTKHTVKFGIKT